MSGRSLRSDGIAASVVLSMSPVSLDCDVVLRFADGPGWFSSGDSPDKGRLVDELLSIVGVGAFVVVVAVVVVVDMVVDVDVDADVGRCRRCSRSANPRVENSERKFP